MTFNFTALPGGTGRLLYIHDFLQREEADRLLCEFSQTLPWASQTITMFGKTVEQPRRIAYLADNERLEYAYAREPLPLTRMDQHPSMLHLKQCIESLLGTPFNSVLCNKYRNGRDYMGFHSDDERELRGFSGKDEEVTIASISLGAERRFLFEARSTEAKAVQGKKKVEYVLAHGSLLVMAGTTQTHWKHALPKMLKVQGERVNLTFRLIQPRQAVEKMRERVDDVQDRTVKKAKLKECS